MVTLVDVRHLVRNLRRTPASAAAAILTLSLTLGAGASIFAVVDAVLLTPPPFAHPDSLVTLGEVPIDDPASAPRAVGYGTFAAWRERAGSMATIEASDGTNLTLTGLGVAERVAGSNVTPGFLALLGVTPAFGRTFVLDDVGQPVVIISHEFWRGKLGADPGAIGRRLSLGGQLHTIVGVLPQRLRFTLGAQDFWRPFPVTPAVAARTGYRVSAVARLAGAASAADLARALDDVSRRSSPPARVVARKIAAAIAGDATRMLGLLAGAAALAMAVAFTNLAGLLLVRSIDRGRELAVRSALGAPRTDVARQLLLEAQMLVVLGIAGGVLVAAWIAPVVGRLAVAQNGALAGRDVAVSWRVVAFLAIVASGCAWLCGLLPAFAATRQNIAAALRRGATPPPRERRLRRVLVTCEVAFAFVLLVSVTLVGRSLVAVLDVTPGFDARGVLGLSISVPAAKYDSGERVAAFYAALQRALEERLGPGTISIIDEMPLTGDRGRSVVKLRPADAGREAVVRTASTAYFDVMRIPILAGRSFAAGDDRSAPLRVVISESLARWLFGADQPVGRQVALGASAQMAEVIGVAGDVKHRALDEALVPTVYRSAFQAPSNSNILVVRSSRPDADVIGAVREEVARLDREVPVYGVRSLAAVIDASPGVPARRVLTAAFAGFALLALALSALGLFGVAGHDVACRRAEFAIRIALGADRARILRTILGQGAVIVGFGLVAGTLLSIWATRALAAVIFATGQLDPVVATLPAAILVLASAAAVLPPAVRAARTDPVAALRAE